MIRSASLALASHWRRQPMQLATLILGLALATEMLAMRYDGQPRVCGIARSVPARRRVRTECVKRVHRSWCLLPLRAQFIHPFSPELLR